VITSRLLKNAHLRRYPHSSSLRRTLMYASLFGISGALHLDVFDQPAREKWLLRDGVYELSAGRSRTKRFDVIAG